MKTFDQIEKRRRELQYITYFVMYLLSLVVFGLFFFVDQFVGFFGTLKYNVFLRTYFVSFVIAVIIYLAHKERRQANMTKELLAEMNDTSEKLLKELRNKQFLSDVSYMVANLQDNAVLGQLFNATLDFLHADGGVVVLRDPNYGWKPPLVSYPDEVDAALIDEVTRVVGKTGRSILQPDPDLPDHARIKDITSLVAVPLRLEGRLYGLIAFWSDTEVVFDLSELAVLEVIARQATNSAVTVEVDQEKNEQFKALLRLVALTTQDGSKNKDYAGLVAGQASALANKLGLAPASVEAIEIAAMLADVGSASNGGASHKTGADQVKLLKSLGFSKRVTEIMHARNGTNGHSKNVTRQKSSGPALSAQILDLAEAFVAAAHPKRGRAPAPDAVIKKVENDPKGYDRKLVNALKDLASSANGKDQSPKNVLTS